MLSGCGSDSSSSKTPTQSPIKLINTQGKLLDDYIENGKVCIDKNQNGACEANEPQAMSNNKGEFTISHPEADLNQFPLVAEVSPEAKDIAFDAPIGMSFSLSSPAGVTVISPMTTMLHHSMKQGMSEADAVEHFQNMTGLSIDPKLDYVEASVNKTQLSHAQIMARVMTSAIAKDWDKLKGALTGHKMNAAQLMALKLDHIERNMDLLKKEQNYYQQHAATTPHRPDHFSSLMSQAISLEPHQLKAKMNVFDAKVAKTKVDATLLFASPGFITLTSFNEPRRQLTPGFQTVKFDSNNNDTRKITSKLQGDAFSVVESASRTPMLVLDDGVWVKAFENNMEVQKTKTSDNQLILKNKHSNIKFSPQFKQYKTSNMNIKALLDQDENSKAWRQLLPVEAVFSDAAKIYELNYQRLNDSYQISNQLHCDNSLPKRFADPEQQICNYVFSYQKADEAWEVGADVDSLLTSPSNGNIKLLKGPIVSWDGYRHIVAEMQLGEMEGKVTYYRVQYELNHEDDSKFKKVTLVATGKWRSKLVNGVKIYHMDLPEAVVHFGRHNSLPKSAFLVNHNGIIRYGEYNKANEFAYKPQLAFNQAAINDLINASDFTKQPSNIDHTGDETMVCRYDDNLNRGDDSGTAFAETLISQAQYQVTKENCFLYGKAPVFSPELLDDKQYTLSDEKGQMNYRMDFSADGSVKVTERKPNEVFAYSVDGTWVMENNEVMVKAVNPLNQEAHEFQMSLIEQRDGNISLKQSYKKTIATPSEGGNAANDRDKLHVRDRCGSGYHVATHNDYVNR